MDCSLVADPPLYHVLFGNSPIDRLGDFTGIGLKHVLPNRYAVRQLIAQEVGALISLRGLFFTVQYDFLRGEMD